MNHTGRKKSAHPLPTDTGKEHQTDALLQYVNPGCAGDKLREEESSMVENEKLNRRMIDGIISIYHFILLLEPETSVMFQTKKIKW